MYHIIASSFDEKIDKTVGRGEYVVKTFPGFLSIDERIYNAVNTNQANMWAGQLTSEQLIDPNVVGYSSALMLYHKYGHRFSKSKLRHIVINIGGEIIEVVEKVQGQIDKYHISVKGGTFYKMIEQDKTKNSEWARLYTAGIEVVQIVKGATLQNTPYYGVYLRDFNNPRLKSGIILTYEYINQHGKIANILPEYANIINGVAPVQQPVQQPVQNAPTPLVQPVQTPGVQVINQASAQQAPVVGPPNTLSDGAVDVGNGINSDNVIV